MSTHNILKPKSEEDILNSMDKADPSELLISSIKNHHMIGVLNAIERGGFDMNAFDYSIEYKFYACSLILIEKGMINYSSYDNSLRSSTPLHISKALYEKTHEITKKFNINYPDDFYDFSNGVDLTNEEIKSFILNCLIHIDYEMKNGEQNSYYCNGTGNTIVIARSYKSPIENMYDVDITVCKKYSDYTLSVEIK
jgi:hypothetical protein